MTLLDIKGQSSQDIIKPQEILSDLKTILLYDFETSK